MAPRLILISPDFTRLWCGQAVSSLGDMVFSTTLMLWVATVLAGEETWAPAAVSGVLVAGGTAVLVVGPIAGVFVDRWDKRRIMLGTEALRGALVALLTAVAFLPTDALPAGVWLALVYGTVLVLHAAARVFAPARFTIIADLMKGGRRPCPGGGYHPGDDPDGSDPEPAAGRAAVLRAGVQWALLFNALSYLVSYLAIRSVRIPEPTKAPLQKDSSSKAVAVEGAPPAEGGRAGHSGKVRGLGGACGVRCGPALLRAEQVPGRVAGLRRDRAVRGRCLEHAEHLLHDPEPEHAGSSLRLCGDGDRGGRHHRRAVCGPGGAVDRGAADDLDGPAGERRPADRLLPSDQSPRRPLRCRFSSRSRSPC